MNTAARIETMLAKRCVALMTSSYLFARGIMKSQGAGILASDTKGVACSIDLGCYFLALASVPGDGAMLV